jgi:hypothetical protein
MIETQSRTVDEVEIPSSNPDPLRPEFIRLPKPGHLCPHTGMSRSALNDLILPTENNGNKPPVKSFVLRKRGAKTGIRLIDYASLADHIRTEGAIA